MRPLRKLKQLVPSLFAEDWLVVLQEGDSKFTSVSFTKQLDNWLSNKSVTFVTGGADGLTNKLMASAEYQLALSSLTFSDDLA